MEKCNHFIGIVNSYDASPSNELHFSDYREKCLEKTKYSKLKPVDIITKRKGLADLYAFCPRCGSKIYWKSLIDGINTIEIEQTNLLAIT